MAAPEDPPRPAPAPSASPPAVDPPVTARLVGVDVARGLAIAGMLTRHIGPAPTDPTVASAAWLYTRTDGRAAVLFALVAGVGVALLADRYPPRWLTARLLYRAAWLLPLGLWLQSLDHPVAVILQFYALYFVAVRPFARRSDAVVLTSAAALAVLGPAAVLTAQVARPEWSSHLGGDAPNLVVDLLLTGHYPVVTYLVPVLVGLWLGRWLLRWRRRGSPAREALTVGATGAGVAVVVAALSLPLSAAVTPDPRALTWATTVDGHSQMPLWLVASTATAVAVVAIACWLSDRAVRLVVPAAAFGRLALTVYVAHLLAFPAGPEGWMQAETVAGGAVRVGGVVVLATLFAVLWLRWRPRGPLEGLERWPFERTLGRWLRGSGEAHGDATDPLRRTM